MSIEEMVNVPEMKTSKLKQHVRITDNEIILKLLKSPLKDC